MTNAQVLNIPIELIDIAPQVRTKFKEETIAELAADIRAHGVLQPLIVQQNGKRFTLLIGGRRLRAIRYLGDATVPAIIATVSKDMAEEVQLMENIQREDLNTADLAAAVKNLWKKHGSVIEVAKRINKSHSWVSKRLAIALNVGKSTAALLDANVKDVELLYHFIKLEKLNPKKAGELVAPIIAGTIGRDDVKDWILDDGKAEELSALTETDTGDDSQQSDLFDGSAGEDRQADTEELNALKQQCEAMKKALVKIATMKDLRALYKTRDEMKRIAFECLNREFP
jgi:ParB family chromosome partitioning protein